MYVLVCTSKQCVCEAVSLSKGHSRELHAYIHTCIYIYICMYLYVPPNNVSARQCPSARATGVSCMHTYIHAHAYTYSHRCELHAYIHTCTCIYIHLHYVCIFVYMYTCMYVCIPPNNVSARQCPSARATGVSCRRLMTSPMA